MANYEIQGSTIIANIAKLSAKELKEIKNYRELGYELIAKQKEKLTKEKKEENRRKNPYAKQNVEKFLNRPENKELLKEYQNRYNEQAGTNRHKRDEKTGEMISIPDEPKYLKNREPKKKGYAWCIVWFKEKFECEYDEDKGECVYTPRVEK